ncbi:MAG: hypothetical protein OXG39_02380 [Chloroflexi bacterium]|nr:hypothetical protein [Chloroflexota bacterium]
MAWTAPKTDWEVGELVSPGDMNEVGENLATLKNPATAINTTSEEIRVVGNEFSDLDSTNLNLTITTTGGDVLVHFDGAMARNVGPNRCHFDVDVDGTRQGGDNGLTHIDLVHGDRRHSLSFDRLIQGLSAGFHTFKLQWKGNDTGRGLILYPGAQFWVREI